MSMTKYFGYPSKTLQNLISRYLFFAVSTYHHWRCEFESHSGDTTLCNKVCQWLAAGWIISSRTNSQSTMWLVGWLMVFNATFNNISVWSWWSVSLVKETGIPGEKHQLPQVTDKLYYIMLNQPTNHMVDWLLVREDIIHPVAKVFRHWHGLLDLSIIEIYSS
jgi:hypothetical protein